MHKVLVNPLVKLAEGKKVVRLTDRLDMAIAVDWDIKPQTKQNKINVPGTMNTSTSTERKGFLSLKRTKSSIFPNSVSNKMHVILDLNHC